MKTAPEKRAVKMPPETSMGLSRAVSDLVRITGDGDNELMFEALIVVALTALSSMSATLGREKSQEVFHALIEKAHAAAARESEKAQVH